MAQAEAELIGPEHRTRGEVRGPGCYRVCRETSCHSRPGALRKAGWCEVSGRRFLPLDAPLRTLQPSTRNGEIRPHSNRSLSSMAMPAQAPQSGHCPSRTRTAQLSGQRSFSTVLQRCRMLAPSDPSDCSWPAPPVYFYLTMFRGHLIASARY